MVLRVIMKNGAEEVVNMAGLDPTMQEVQEPADKSSLKKASQEEEMDLEIAVRLSKKLMKEAGGLDAVKQVISASQDPVQVVAKFLVQLILQVKDEVAKQGVELSANIVLGQGGWLVQMLDLLEQELGLPQEFSDGIVDDVIETFKALSQGGKGGTPPQGAAPTQGQPTAGPPMMGG